MTDYLYRTDTCAACTHYTEIRIGDVTPGWSFRFRGYPHDVFGFPVRSRADWRRAFTERPGEVWDEYGHRVGDALDADGFPVCDMTPLVWLDALDAPDDAQVRREDELADYSWSGGRGWRDTEGFRFEESA